jgi:UDP-N-acetylglucosamine 2-epimerase (non-hydrolysing)
MVRSVVAQTLGDVANVSLLPPLSYPDFVQLIELSDLILTDSGGIQEEAPTLGKPVLVMRNETERPEAIETGTARLVGNTKAQIVRETKRLLHDTSLRVRMSRQGNPFGDGRASERIVAHLAHVHRVDQIKRSRTHVS